MGTIDRLRQIKLTKKNCQKLLELLILKMILYLSIYYQI